MIWPLIVTLALAPLTWDDDPEHAVTPADVMVIDERAGESLAAREYGRARADYLWLWRHGAEVDPGYLGVRLSYLMAEVETLVRLDAASREAFVAEHDALWDDLRTGSLEPETWRDGLVLGRALGRSDALLDWLAEPGVRSRVARLALSTQRDVVELHVQAGRLAQAGELPVDLLALARHCLELQRVLASQVSPQLDSAGRRFVEASAARSVRRQLLGLVAVAAASERSDDGERLGELLIGRLDDGPTRCAVVDTALAHGRPRACHHRWALQAWTHARDAGEQATARALLERVEAELPAGGVPVVASR